MRLTVPLDEGVSRDLDDLAADADSSRAEWVRGAIKAASSDQHVADAIAAQTDGSGWGGHRPGAGRPKQTA